MVSPACAAALGRDALAWLSPAQVQVALVTMHEDVRQDASSRWLLKCLPAAEQLLAAVATTQTQVIDGAAPHVH